MEKPQFFNRVRELRLESGLSRDELAEVTGVGSGAIGHYERGDSPINQPALEALTAYFECSADYLLGLSDHKPEKPYGANVIKKLEALLAADVAANRDCTPQYNEILDVLLGISRTAEDALSVLPEDPDTDDLAKYYSKLNAATADAAMQLRLIVSMELYPALIKKK